jgi:hypothetical protein
LPCLHCRKKMFYFFGLSQPLVYCAQGC